MKSIIFENKVNVSKEHVCTGWSVNTHLFRSVVVVRQTAAESSLAAHVHLSVRLLFTVRVHEDGGAAGVGHLPSNPPTHIFKSSMIESLRILYLKDQYVGFSGI